MITVAAFVIAAMQLGLIMRHPLLQNSEILYVEIHFKISKFKHFQMIYHHHTAIRLCSFGSNGYCAEFIFPGNEFTFR